MAITKVTSSVLEAAQPNITSVGTLTGLDVAGTPTFDGLTVDGSSSVTGALSLGVSGSVNGFINTGESLYINIDSNNDQADSRVFQVAKNSTDGSGGKLLLASENGDISFYDDTGVSQALFWDASAERLGIGTTSPDAILETSGTATGNTVGALLTNTNGAGTADSVSLNFGLGRTVDALIFSIPAIKLLKEQQWTGTASTVDASLVFSTVENETTAERVRITSAGNLLVGTTAISGKINVYYSSAFGQIMRYTGASANIYPHIFEYGSSTIGSISGTSTATSYNTSSDYRLKENVSYDFNALDRVAQLKPARFNFIADADTTVDGFLAHEVQDIVPEAITGVKDAVDNEGNPVYQGIDQSKLVPLLTKAIQELSDKVDNQQTIIDNLTTRIETLENA